MPFHIGPTELIIILVIIMVVFGVGKLPQVGGAIGKGLREFRKAQSDTNELAKPTTNSAPEAQEEGKAKKEGG